MENSQYIKEHRCEACGGTMIFDPHKGKLVCEYCGTEYAVPDDMKTAGAQNQAAAAGAGGVPPEIAGFDFTQFYNSAKVEQGENLPVYHCRAAHAALIRCLVDCPDDIFRQCETVDALFQPARLL